METVSPDVCGFNCKFEWIEISSNFFNISVYTPALVAGAVIYVMYRVIKKTKAARDKKQ